MMDLRVGGGGVRGDVGLRDQRRPAALRRSDGLPTDHSKCSRLKVKAGDRHNKNVSTCFSAFVRSICERLDAER